MRVFGVIVNAPFLGLGLCLSQVVEDFAIETFVTELAAEDFCFLYDLDRC